MAKLIVIGSGPSGVHYALTALKKGYQVLMLDVGYQKPDMLNPLDSFNQLKEQLPDPAEYFLGKEFESVIHPGKAGEYYGFPPSKSYVFSHPPQYNFSSQGFAPLASFARGGLAEAWTGGVYPFNDDDLKEFPISYSDMSYGYDEVARRIGISGAKDDLEKTMPVHEHILDPIKLDEHSSNLLEKYDRKKGYFNKSLNCYLGRARLATLTRDQGERKACDHKGRCLWGCPQASFYTPSLTLRECEEYESFSYLPHHFVKGVRVTKHNRISHVVADSLATKEQKEFEVETLVLAAGTLSSSRIFLEAVRERSGQAPRLSGLMDNQQILIPFINWDMIGKPYNDKSYQYHQIAFNILSNNSDPTIHALITTLKTALVHPLIHRIPCDLKSAVFFFRNLHAAMGLVNVNLHDSRRENSFISLRKSNAGSASGLDIQYSHDSSHATRVKKAVRVVKRILRQLGCFVPPPMVHIRPIGASVHYAGTLPMSRERKPLTVSLNCQSHDFDNLYIVDGTTFPFLPAKNITFSLMANAVRVANNTL